MDNVNYPVDAKPLFVLFYPTYRGQLDRAHKIFGENVSDTSDFLDIRLDLTPETARAMLRLLAQDKGDLADVILQAILLADAVAQSPKDERDISPLPAQRYRH